MPSRRRNREVFRSSSNILAGCRATFTLWFVICLLGGSRSTPPRLGRGFTVRASFHGRPDWSVRFRRLPRAYWAPIAFANRSAPSLIISVGISLRSPRRFGTGRSRTVDVHRWAVRFI